MTVRWISLILICFLTDASAQKITPLGSGLTIPGSVYDIAVDESSNISYYVGDFSAIDQVKMQKVGQLSNDIWSAIEDTSKIDGVVFCVEVHDGALHIGGNFTIESSTEIINLAKLVDGKWQPLGIEFMSGSIRSISWFEGELYTTGDLRSINGIKNNGVMKYSNGLWKDSGLNSQLNANEMFVAGDTLFAWGSGFYGNSNVSHTVSYYTNQSWTTLSGIGTSESCVYHKGKIYCTKGNVLYVYSEEGNTWINLGTGSSLTYEDILFEYNGGLYIIFDHQEIYRIEDDSLILYEIENLDNVFFKFIYTIKSINTSIVIGGYFHHWDTHSVSLCKIKGNKLCASGKVASDLSSNRDGFSVGSSIVRYNDKYLIAGKFSFADGVYSPNLVYWDGVDFSPFEAPLLDGVKQIEVFENELYALPQFVNKWTEPSISQFRLIKFDGKNWDGWIGGGDKIEIIDGKRFSLVDNYYSNSEPKYLKDGVVYELPPVFIEGVTSWHRFGHIRSYKNGMVMVVESSLSNEYYLLYLANESSDWEVIANFVLDFDSMHSIDNRIFLIHEHPDIIYEVTDGIIDTLVEGLDGDLALFFSMNDKLHYSAWSESTHSISEETMGFYNSLRVRNIEKLSNNQYLAALNSRSYDAGVDRISLNKICLITFDSLEVSMKQDAENICPKNHVQY